MGVAVGVPVVVMTVSEQDARQRGAACATCVLLLMPPA